MNKYPIKFTGGPYHDIAITLDEVTVERRLVFVTVEEPVATTPCPMDSRGIPLPIGMYKLRQVFCCGSPMEPPIYWGFWAGWSYERN